MPMTPNSKSDCPKCQSEMIHGFVADHSMKAALVAGWHAGRPGKKLEGHTRAPRDESVLIGAHCCRGCGFLEFYTDPKFAAQ